MDAKIKAAYQKRKRTLKKKSNELSTLCDIPVCLICYDNEKDVDTWPKNSDVVSQDLARFYSGNQDMLPRILEGNTSMVVRPPWEPELDYLSDDELECNLNLLKEKLAEIEEKERTERIDQDEVDADSIEEDNTKVDSDQPRDGSDSAITDDSNSVPADSNGIDLPKIIIGEPIGSLFPPAP